MSALIAAPAVEIISTTYYVCYQRPVEWLHSTGVLLLLLFLCYPAPVQCIDAPLHRLPALSVVCARSLARSLRLAHHRRLRVWLLLRISAGRAAFADWFGAEGPDGGREAGRYYLFVYLD